eukprot:scaffold15098_cov69-Skeletonema_menzelii.AAC.1
MIVRRRRGGIMMLGRDGMGGVGRRVIIMERGVSVMVEEMVVVNMMIVRITLKMKGRSHSRLE